MNHIMQPEALVDSGLMLQILPVTISCNNNAPTVFNTRRTVFPSLMHQGIFLKQSTVGQPFADVMRRNVAFMEPHYTERRFSFLREVSNLFTGALNMPAKMHLQSTYCMCIQIGLFCNYDLGQMWWNRDKLVLKECEAETKECFSDRPVGCSHSFYNPGGFKYIVVIVLSCILCTSGIGSGSSPTANHKPIWPHYNLSHSRVIAFKTKCSCWKGNVRIQTLHRDIKGKVIFAIQVQQHLYSCDDNDERKRTMLHCWGLVGFTCHRSILVLNYECIFLRVKCKWGIGLNDIWK